MMWPSEMDFNSWAELCFRGDLLSLPDSNSPRFPSWEPPGCWDWASAPSHPVPTQRRYHQQPRPPGRGPLGAQVIQVGNLPKAWPSLSPPAFHLRNGKPFIQMEYFQKTPLSLVLSTCWVWGGFHQKCARSLQSAPVSSHMPCKHSSVSTVSSNRCNLQDVRTIVV